MIDAVRDHLEEHRWGVLFDLVFAIAWVSVVTVLFQAVGGPRWAYYAALAAGVVAYYGFVGSLEAVGEETATGED